MSSNSNWTSGRVVPSISIGSKRNSVATTLNPNSQNYISVGKRNSDANSPISAKKRKNSDGNYKNTKDNTLDSNKFLTSLQISPRMLKTKKKQKTQTPIKITSERKPIEEKSRILWFLKNTSSIILESVDKKKYIIAKPRNKNTSQMKVWKGKPPVEVRASCEYRSSTHALNESRECFIPIWNDDQISFGLKDKVWIIDQYDMVRILKPGSQFERRWFDINFYGDFFSLRCSVNSRYIGVNLDDNQLECKQESVSSPELFKLSIKGALKSKLTFHYLAVKPDSVPVTCNSPNITAFETLIIEIGGVNCRIYSCSGTQKNYRRYLSCWKDEHIEGTWHLGFPLYGQFTVGKIGFLPQEEFELIHQGDNFYSIRACNDKYISWNGSRLQALSTNITDACLFEIVPIIKAKSDVTRNIVLGIQNTAMVSMPIIVKNSTDFAYKSINKNLLPPVPTRNHTSNNYTNTQDSPAMSSTFQDIEFDSMRENYRRSICTFLKEKPKMSNSNLDINSPAEYLENNLLTKEAIVAQIPNIAETTNVSCIVGSLFITNYRVWFIPFNINIRETKEWRMPLGSISQITLLGQIGDDFEENYCYTFEIVGKHWLQLDTENKKIYSGYHFLSTMMTETPDKIESEILPILTLLSQITFPRDVETNLPTQYFAFTHRVEYISDKGWSLFDIEYEYFRQIRKYNSTQTKWRLFGGNKNFALCSSYPEFTVQPYQITDKEMAAIAKHRSKMRFPAVTWIHPTNGAAFLRCSQPKQGWKSSKSYAEGKYFSLICSQENPLIWIMDARPQINAMANRLKGAGYEDLEHYKEETYTVRMKFLGIGNIHVMRDSLRKLQKITQESNYDSINHNISNLCWFDHLKLLLKSSLRIATKIQSEGQTVVLHCSDGWDRTAQLASLSQLYMDGYFRTIKGFCILIEKDWLSYGHKFADRTGQGDINFKCKERSPIFVQFIDCMYQLIEQYPTQFEFNQWFLLAILEHFTSARFGTFLYNTCQEREQYQVKKKTHSLWNILLDNSKYKNHNYKPSTLNEFIVPFQDKLKLWKLYYFPSK